MVKGVRLKIKVFTPTVIMEKRVYCCPQIAAGYGIKLKIVLNRNRPKHFLLISQVSNFYCLYKPLRKQKTAIAKAREKGQGFIYFWPELVAHTAI